MPPKSTDHKLTLKELMNKGLSRNEAGICYRFRQIRIDRQLLQEEMAGILGTGVGSIKHIENGRRPPHLEEIIILHKVFQLSFEWIILGKESSTTQKK